MLVGDLILFSLSDIYTMNCEETLEFNVIVDNRDLIGIYKIFHYQPQDVHYSQQPTKYSLT